MDRWRMSRIVREAVETRPPPLPLRGSRQIGDAVRLRERKQQTRGGKNVDGTGMRWAWAALPFLTCDKRLWCKRDAAVRGRLRGQGRGGSGATGGKEGGQQLQENVTYGAPQHCPAESPQQILVAKKAPSDKRDAGQRAGGWGGDGHWRLGCTGATGGGWSWAIFGPTLGKG